MKSIKKENGAITVITLVTVLFMVSFLISSYILISNKVKTQKDIIDETRDIYESKATMEEIYNSYFNIGNIVPIYTPDQLLNIGTNNKNININGKYYDFNNDENTVYVLMNDIKFKVSDYMDKLSDGYWTPIGDNTTLIAKFDGNGHTIEVLYDDDSKIYSLKNDYCDEWVQNKDGTVSKGKTTLKIGDYINYEEYVSKTGDKADEIDKLYEELKEYSGYDETDSKAGSTIIKEDTLKWRVLDAKDGNLRLISEKPTTSKVYLKGYNGYNNAVYLIDKVCSTLYTTEKGTVQNLKIEDIQDVMNLSTWDYHDYSNSNVTPALKYGGTSEEYTGTNSYYPEIFGKEKTGCVDDVQGREFDLSEQKDPIKQSTKTPTNPTDENNKIKITQTYWVKSMSESNWKNKEYQNIFIKDSKGSNYSLYWLSSRSVGAHLDCASFDVRAVGSGKVDAWRIYDSDNTNRGYAYCLRPVLSLSFKVQIEAKADETYSIK